MKRKIEYLQFREKLKRIGKTYFSFAELKKFYSHNKGSLKVLLSHWTAKGLIYHLGKGFYAFDLANADFLRLVNDLDENSYISFEYGLYFHHLINQVPSLITCATGKRSRQVALSNWTFEFSHLKNNLLFGYELRNKIFLATPEKALADLIYLVSRGKRIFEFDTLEWEKINKNKLREILKKFPAYTQRLAEELKF